VHAWEFLVVFVVLFDFDFDFGFFFGGVGVGEGCIGSVVIRRHGATTTAYQ
jgi:hypothetical protein